MKSVRIRGEYTKLTIRDLSSVNGVKVNGDRIAADTDVEITIDPEHTWNAQDPRHVAGRGYGGFVDVKLGDNTSFRLERVDWSICSLGLSAQQKVTIIEAAAEIDAKVEDTWIPGISTHLIIGSNKRAEKKLFLALAEGGHLVDLAWLAAQEQALKESWNSKGATGVKTLEFDYPGSVPTMFENGNIQWTPNHARRKLFQNHRFFSVSKTKYSNLDQVIECAGGIWSAEDPKTAPRLISECYRWVYEDEIGMAIVYASTEMFCNPKYQESLPTVEMMASMQASQLTNPFGTMPTFVVPEVSSFDGLAIKDSTTSPHVIQDSIEPSSSLSFSQLLAPTKSRTRGASQGALRDVPQPPKLDAVGKPDKKKAKLDRMAMFFDGLDDDEDVIVLDEPGPQDTSVTTITGIPSQLQLPTALSTSRHSSNLQTPVPVAWPEPIDLVSEQDTIPDASSTTPATPEDTEQLQEAAHPPAREGDIVHEKIDKQEEAKTAPADFVKPIKQEAPSQAIGSGKPPNSRKKPSKFDAIRDDMVALKLDVKVGRQKDNMEEREKWARRQADRSKEASTKIMQSQRSELVLAKNKRRKMGKGVSQEGAPSELSLAENGTVSEVDQKDWPEHWKRLPNFKHSANANVVARTKWQNVPNFKTFRKSLMPGVPVDPTPPRSLAIDGVLVKKQEEMIHKIGGYLKRETEEPAMASPAPRRKKSEKQMARDDLKALLADD
ncbi:hypothetical protein BGZ70_007986 [Mortierella alpina]|uniref:FHA domain-containing protein n=1 Tax=Mortierella alpina TaxID=64518 RepID=A0A9P6JDS6_MORAP|nr:hypothetical protein BGZ70_007986 [Mortierella alpina]